MKKLLLLLVLVSCFSCSSDDNSQTSDTDNYDRKAMLINWADNIIIPAFSNFADKTSDLKAAAQSFKDNTTSENYETLVGAWETAYLAFQEVSMFDIGEADNLRFTYNLNIYPTDVTGINANITDGDYNFELPSEVDRQGFPALDYLLFGVAEGQAAILSFYQNDNNTSAHLAYINDLAIRIDDLAQSVLSDWNGGYRDEFVDNSGNSASASVDKLTNDFIFYYEKHLRAGKIGIPAGVFSGDPLSNTVEAFYRGNFSKELFNRALDATQNFFNGVHFNSTTKGESMRTYLEYLDVNKNGENLGKVIDDQFNVARTTAVELDDNFAAQVEADNVKMLATYDQLQFNVVHIKVDMLQALNVNVDYVDADGD